MHRLATLAASIYLFTVFIAATQTRYIADDYCQAADAATYGVIGEVGHIYQTWNGRYSQSIISSLIYTTLGENAPRIFLPLAIAGILGSLVLFFRRWSLVIIGLAAFVMSINFFQGMLWVQGVTFYMLPIPLALFFWRSCWQGSQKR